MQYNYSVLRTTIVILTLTLILTATSWSLFHPSLFRVHDFVHGARVAEMTRGILDGQLPVRWSQNFGYGYGAPVFEFYAPLPYFFGALLMILGLPIELIIKLLFFVPSLLTVVFAYRLAREWFRIAPALLAAAAIALAPYRAVNLFVRGAVAEAWGMAFLIISLLGVSQLAKGKAHAWLLYTVGLTGLILSHNLTAMIAVPVLAVWFGIALLAHTATLSHHGITLQQVQENLKHGGRLFLGSTLLGLGVTIFYWLPALAEKQFTQVDQTILSGYFEYYIHFLSVRQFFQPFWGYGGSSWGAVDGISFFLGYAQIIGSVLTTGALLYFFWRQRWSIRSTLSSPTVIIALGTGCIALLAAFMAIQRSHGIWEWIPLLHTLQFPWRFLAIVSTMIGLFSVIWITFDSSQKRTKVLSGVFFIVALFNARYFQPETYLSDTAELYYTDAKRIQSEMSSTLPDFNPIALTATEPPTAPLICREPEDCSITDTVTQQSNLTEIKLLVHNDTTATVSVAAYPGWKMVVDGDEQSWISSDDGLLEIPLSQGERTVRWFFGTTMIRQIADGITLVSAAVLLILGAIHIKTSRSRR